MQFGTSAKCRYPYFQVSTLTGFTVKPHHPGSKMANAILLQLHVQCSGIVDKKFGVENFRVILKVDCSIRVSQ